MPVSRARNGTAESTWPSWPQIPVSWVTSGTWRGLNQCGTRRNTEMKVTRVAQADDRARGDGGRQ